jgi:hypothetical protein
MSNHKAAKSLTIGVCAAVLWLLLLTLSSCYFVGGVDPEDPHFAEEAAATREAATAIAGAATYEAMSEAEAAEAAATVAARATIEAEAAATWAAQATEQPVPIGACTTPGASCLVEGKFMLELYYPEDSIFENWVDIVFPVDGGAVSGDYRFSHREDMSGADWTCVYRFDYPGTLSGNYDPASGHMEGAVHGGKGTWTVLEGCEDIESLDIGTVVSWSAWYDAVTGHVAGQMADEGGEGVFPFEGYARPGQDKTTEF